MHTNFRSLSRNCLVALVYLAFGKLGLMLATTQENVSLVWAPTGIALCAVLLWGYGVWPGLVVGAFLVNVTTSAPLAVALATAVGNPLEALTGAYLLQRVGFEHSLRRVRDVLALVLLAAGVHYAGVLTVVAS